jgi:Tfp pilus assembly protein PilF
MGMVGNLHLERGIAYKIAGNYVAAMDELKQALNEEPENGEVHHQMGLVLCFIGEFDESIASLQKAAALDSSVVILNDLALTYAMLSMDEEAKACFEDVLRRDPENEIANKNIEFYK